MAFKRGIKDDFVKDFAHGRRPEHSKEYPIMQETVTRAEREQQGEVFDHSDMVKVYQRPRQTYGALEQFLYPHPDYKFYNSEFQSQLPAPVSGVPGVVTSPCGQGFIWAGTPVLLQCDEESPLIFYGGGGKYTVQSVEPLVNGGNQVVNGDGSITGKANLGESSISVSCEDCQDLLDYDCDSNTGSFPVTFSDECGAVYNVIMSVECATPATLVVSGSNSVTQNTTSQYTTSGGRGAITWSVSGSDTGTAPTISSSGLLSVNDGCGTLTVTATDACGVTDSIDLRVTDSGQWDRIFGVCDISAGSTCLCDKGAARTYFEGKYKLIYGLTCEVTTVTEQGCPITPPLDDVCTVGSCCSLCGGKPCSIVRGDLYEWIC